MKWNSDDNPILFLLFNHLLNSSLSELCELSALKLDLSDSSDASVVVGVKEVQELDEVIALLDLFCKLVNVWLTHKVLFSEDNKSKVELFFRELLTKIY